MEKDDKTRIQHTKQKMPTILQRILKREIRETEETKETRNKIENF